VLNNSQLGWLHLPHSPIASKQHNSINTNIQAALERASRGQLSYSI